MVKYVWGMDGYGRAHVGREDNLIVLLCMLPGVSGLEGRWMLEDQDAS